MSNQFIGSPPRWVIDTPSATAITTDLCAIRYIEWVSVTAAAGDVALIQDAAGNVIWNPVAPGPDFVSDEIHFADKIPGFNGLKVPTLTSGKLYIYFR